MKAITLTEPWATLVALGEKKIETRAHTFPSIYRGPIAIHAAKSFPTDCRELCDDEPFRSALKAHGLGIADLCHRLGRVLCITTLEDVIATQTAAADVRKYSDKAYELDFGNYDHGRKAIVFGNIDRTFNEPIPAIGMLGLWDWQEPEL